MLSEKDKTFGWHVVKGFGGVFVAYWVVCALLSLGFIGLVAYVLFHFIAKAW